MEEREIILEVVKTLKECVILQTPEIKDKENRLWRNLIIKMYCFGLAAIIVITLLFVASDMYKTYKIYDYQGYPDQGTTIENNNIGGDSNGKATETTKTPKTTETTKEKE